MPAVPKRIEITPGLRVRIVEKQNQRSGQLTEGVVARLLTSSPTHPHGIKVMLTNGLVGRVQAIVPPAAGQPSHRLRKTDSFPDEPPPSKPA